MILYVFEYLHAALTSQDATPEMEQEGRAMLDRLACDLATLPNATVKVVLHESRRDLSFPHEIVWHSRTNSFADLLDCTERDAHWHVIAPEFDDILRNVCKELISRGFGYHGLPIDLIEKFGDKLRTFDDLGSPVVTTWSDPSHTRGTDMIVVKPRFGCGSMHVGITKPEHVHSLIDRVREEGYSCPLVFQPWIEGRAVSMAAIGHGEQGYTLLPLADQHITKRSDGPLTWLHYEGGQLPSEIDPAPVESVVRQLLDRLPSFTGYVGLDLVVPENSPPVIIEVNPRLTLSYVGYSHGFEQWTGKPDTFAKLLMGIEHSLPRTRKPVRYTSKGTIRE